MSPSTPIFLTQEELRQLTGYARPMAQLRWIRDRGYLHEIDAKALTDAKRQGLDPKALALHSSDAMTARYLRGREIPVTQGPSLRRLIDAREKQASKP